MTTDKGPGEMPHGMTDTHAADARQRRRLLKALACTPLMGLPGGMAVAGGNNAASAQGREPLGVAISACDDDTGQHFASCTSYQGVERWRQPIRQRAHGATRHPYKPWALIFSRRPGTEINIFHLDSGERIARIEAAQDRHFYGHGVFSPDGGLLYTTENAIAPGEGRIGIYDVNRDFTRIGEFASGGIGPHEIRLSADCRAEIAGCFERDCEGCRSFNRIVKQALPMAHHAQHRTWDVPRSRHPRGVYWRIGLGAASPD